MGPTMTCGKLGKSGIYLNEQEVLIRT
jgi:hypothetical protein